MPGLNGTGPRGEGPRTGRGMGRGRAESTTKDRLTQKEQSPDYRELAREFDREYGWDRGGGRRRAGQHSLRHRRRRR